MRNVLEATQGPQQSVGVLHKFMEQDDDFFTAFTAALRNTATFNSDSVHSPLHAALLLEEHFFSRAHSILLLAVDTTLYNAMVARNLGDSLQ